MKHDIVNSLFTDRGRNQVEKRKPSLAWFGQKKGNTPSSGHFEHSFHSIHSLAFSKIEKLEDDYFEK